MIVETVAISHDQVIYCGSGIETAFPLQRAFHYIEIKLSTAEAVLRRSSVSSLLTRIADQVIYCGSGIETLYPLRPDIPCNKIKLSTAEAVLRFDKYSRKGS